jgi:hypothetical protein
MKKVCLLYALASASLAMLAAQTPQSFDDALAEASNHLKAWEFRASDTVVALHFKAPTQALADFAIEQLTDKLARDPMGKVVEKRNRPDALSTVNSNVDKELSDAEAASYGQNAGATIALTGVFSPSGANWKLNLTAVSVAKRNAVWSDVYIIRPNAAFTQLATQAAAPAAEAPQAAPAGRPAGGGAVAAAPQAPAPAAAGRPGGGAAPAPAKEAAPPASAHKPGDRGPAGGLVFYPAAQKENAKPAPSTRNYKIGDTGPAGGTVFYVNPGAGAWKYLEAAPVKTEVKTFWASEEFPVDGILDARAVGAGKSNSEFIMRQAASRGGGFDWAAEACDSLNVNGFKDWFLPSMDELHMMYGNLGRKGLGDFKAERYWSSTPYKGRYGESYARIENFSDGAQDGADRRSRGNECRVRAIRQF